MSTTSAAPASCKPAVLELTIIPEYTGKNTSIRLLHEDILKILQTRPIDYTRLRAHVITAITRCDEPSSTYHPPALINSVEKLPLNHDVEKLTYAYFLAYEIGLSIHYISRLFHDILKEHKLKPSELHEIRFTRFTKGFIVYPWLHKTTQESLQSIVKQFQDLEHTILKDDLDKPEVKALFTRIQVAIKPILNKSKKSKPPTVPSALEKAVSDILDLSGWEFMESPPMPIPSSSTPAPKPLPPPIKPAHEELTKYIEAVTERVLKHYGETFFKGLINPLSEEFKTEKLRLIISDTFTRLEIAQKPEDREVWIEFICSSIPRLLGSILNITTDSLSGPTQGLEFIRGISRMISPLCFGPGGSFNQQHKSLILNILPELTQFVDDYQDSVKFVRESKLPTKAENDDAIFFSMILKIQARAAPNPIFRDTQDPQIFEEDLQECVKIVLKEQFVALKMVIPFELQEVVLAVLSHYVFTILDTFLSPLLVAIIITRLIENEEKLESPSLPAASTSAPPYEHDDLFTAALSEQLYKAIPPILGLGGNPGLITFLLETFPSTIEGEILSKSKVISLEAHGVFASEFVFKPFKLIDSVLFNHKDGNITPAIKGLLVADAVFQDDYVARILKGFEDKPYKIVKSIVEQKIPSPVLWGINKVASLDEFLKTLFKEILEMVSNKNMLRLLIIPITRGLSKHIKENNLPPPIVLPDPAGTSTGQA